MVEIKWEDSVAPTIVFADDAAYVIGDDKVVYGFDNLAADTQGPVLTDALLDVKGAQNYVGRYRMPVDRGSAFPGRYADLVPVPGTPPISISLSLLDTGSGVDPSSIQVKLDGDSVDSKQIIYNPRQGLLWYVYDPKGAAASLPNGVHNLAISAADWKCNVTAAQVSFTVDNSLPPPAPPVAAGGGMPGGPGGPGMPGMPGGPGMPQGPAAPPG